MSDPLLLAIPLSVLALATLFVFVGCQALFPVEPDEEQENVDTTHGTGPGDYIDVSVEIAVNCADTVNEIVISLTTNINDEHFSVTLTSLSSPVSTTDLNITLDDEGEVYCAIQVTPAEGDAPEPLTQMHEKVTGEEVEPFILDCENGFELT